MNHSYFLSFILVFSICMPWHKTQASDSREIFTVVLGGGLVGTALWDMCKKKEEQRSAFKNLALLVAGSSIGYSAPAIIRCADEIFGNRGFGSNVKAAILANDGKALFKAFEKAGAGLIDKGTKFLKGLEIK